MSEKSPMTRRDLLGVGAGAAAGVVARRLGADAPTAECREATAAQTAGPYYPTRDREDENPDLTQVRGRPGRAAGDVIIVQGRVLDEACRPVAGALVELWQANKWGRYDHEKDAGNPRPLDPNFQSWAEVLTDAVGKFGFTTIKPGSYPAGDQGWVRPPHLHFKVSRRGFHELVTQMYFAGEDLNETDLIRKELSPQERDSVTIALRHAPSKGDPNALVAQFDITIRQVG